MTPSDTGNRMGHEFIGVLDAVGSSVRTVKGRPGGRAVRLVRREGSRTLTERARCATDAVVAQPSNVRSVHRSVEDSGGLRLGMSNALTDAPNTATELTIGRTTRLVGVVCSPSDLNCIRPLSELVEQRPVPIVHTVDLERSATRTQTTQGAVFPEFSERATLRSFTGCSALRNCSLRRTR